MKDAASWGIEKLNWGIIGIGIGIGSLDDVVVVKVQ